MKKALKRILVFLPLALSMIVGIIIAMIMWLFLGDGCNGLTLPLEEQVEDMMGWAEK